MASQFNLTRILYLPSSENSCQLNRHLATGCSFELISATPLEVELRPDRLVRIGTLE